VNQVPSFFIETLGCKLNQLESEAITNAFVKNGFKEAVYSESPSIVIINTCTVTSKADQKARRIIRKVLRDYPDSRVIVTGCYAQLDKDELQKLDDGNPQRLYIIKKDKVLNFLKNNIFFENKKPDSPRVLCASVPQCDNKTINQFEFNPEQFSSHTRSLLKIQDGCDNKCTYCKIRLARGSSVSLDAEEVLSRLRFLEKNHAEAILVGVNICQYKDLKNFYLNSNLRFAHERIKSDLPDLLIYLLSNTEKINLRLSSLEPECIDENFAKVISDKRIRPHFHLSVQSCNENILKKMGRSYNSQIIERAVTLLREVKSKSSCHDPFIACDIITGFAGETENEFKQTYDLCQKLDFAWIHVFPYSKRPGTPAFFIKENVPQIEVTKRVNLFTNLAEKGKAAYIQRWLGREVDVIMENKEGYCLGVSENYLKVYVLHNKNLVIKPGELLRCKLIKEENTKEYDVQAIIV